MKFEDIKEKIKGLQIIGKGWRGVVYKGILDNKILAFKVASRPEVIKAIQKEGKVLEIVNKENIGGRLTLKGEDFIAYQFIEGKHLIDIINENNYKDLIFQIFIQCWKLDNLKINKDEMQRPLKNAIVNKEGKVYLIDFERAKFSKKPSNITQLLQFILNLKDKYFPFIDKEKVINLGKNYKNDYSKDSLKKIINEILGEEYENKC
ncbi:MAG TPA: serine/threonine protein kinase [Persephonella sp.]|nr:serine/threonine protein kinase [Hydrogenothermaceae bacterium]HIQ24768.1 serine/threonine protein kinase [Persephonella sp.]